MSPAATASTTEADDQLLSAADELFYRRGIAGVTMADIGDLSGVSFRRMYARYPAKSDLVSGWLERRHQTWMRWFTGQLADGLAAGRSAVDSTFDAIEHWLRSTDYRGCGFINALAETAEVTADHRDQIRRHKQELRDLLTTHSPDGSALAVLVDGAIVQSTVFRSTEPVDAARRAAHQLLERFDT